MEDEVQRYVKERPLDIKQDAPQNIEQRFMSLMLSQLKKFIVIAENQQIRTHMDDEIIKTMFKSLGIKFKQLDP